MSCHKGQGGRTKKFPEEKGGNYGKCHLGTVAFTVTLKEYSMEYAAKRPMGNFKA